MASLRALVLSLGIATHLFACAETADTYEPCAGKSEGEQCRLCSPDDPNCFETMIVKTCSREGQCGARRNDAGTEGDASPARRIE
jgi:hypothetical protein